MQIFIAALVIFASSGAGAQTFTCQPLLLDTLAAHPHLARISFDRLDELVPSSLQLGVVIEGEDGTEVIAVDAPVARDKGEKFGRTLLADATSPAAWAWRDEVRTRLDAYAEFGDGLEDLARITSAPHLLDHVRNAFFTRTFAWKGRRVMLISLRPPAPVPEAAPPVAMPIPPDGPAARQAPADAWRTLTPARDQPRYVFWEVAGVEPPPNINPRANHLTKLTSRMFEGALMPVADFKRGATGASQIFLPYYNLQFVHGSGEPGAMIYELNFEARPGHEAVRIVRQFEASPVDVLIHAAEFNRHHLEPARRLPLGENDPEVWVPMAVWSTEIDANVPVDAIEKSLDVAFARDPGLRDRLVALPAGARLAFVGKGQPTEPARGRRRAVPPFAMIFGKDDSGKAFVLAWIRSADI